MTNLICPQCNCLLVDGRCLSCAKLEERKKKSIEKYDKCLAKTDGCPNCYDIDTCFEGLRRKNDELGEELARVKGVALELAGEEDAYQIAVAAKDAALDEVARLTCENESLLAGFSAALETCAESKDALRCVQEYFRMPTEEYEKMVLAAIDRLL
jgi:hypothetical protein